MTFLAVTHFKSNVSCVQLYHATGAIKQFGLKDPSNGERNKRDLDRFQKVNYRFDHVVGSEKMTTIFRGSSPISNEQILRSRILRSDFFLDKSAKIFEQLLSEAYPMIQEQRCSSLFHTYLDNQLQVTDIALDIEMYKTLKDEHILLFRLCPAMKVELDNKYPDFIIDVSANHQLSHLLVIADLLITNYSSIPFEFAPLKKPMIFFAYDLDDYTESRGFLGNLS